MEGSLGTPFGHVRRQGKQGVMQDRSTPGASLLDLVTRGRWRILENRRRIPVRARPGNKGSKALLIVALAQPGELRLQRASAFDNLL